MKPAAAVLVAVAALEEDATLQDVLGLLGMDRFQGKRPEGEMNALPDGMVDPTEAPQIQMIKSVYRRIS